MVPEWSVGVRITHWAMFLTVLLLTVTGFYIAKPFTIYVGETTYKFLMGNMRLLHIFFGIFLIFIFILRRFFAYFPGHPGLKYFLSWTDWRNTIKQIKFYLLISRERPEHHLKYGPLQSIAYNGAILMSLLIILTGILLTGADCHGYFISKIYILLKPLERLMGGLAQVRFVHHLLTWCFILFGVVHIYMAFWYDAVFQEGTVSSMIGGNAFKRKEE